MFKTWKEQVAIVLPMVLLTLMDAAGARPRRRFCENYPFAPRCLGVAAKRSPQLENEQTPLDIYSKLIERVLEDVNNRPLTEKGPVVEKPAMFDDSSLWARLVSLVEETDPQQLQRKFKRPSYMDDDQSWDETFGNEQDGI